ncbi:hypothetical protein DW355_02200 [Hylemonella gracilis]|jgi:hypothetical protein|uniref:Immunity protein 35 domain-containing protein n=1 Tax=Hylemonella gracilis TaxID=80880 RepID=A0A4P6UI46_9BURK|nr:YrhB domain-containing protein [Hylemonella gracilis]QBK03740.1 hypothetical protein DW355_02200 [Hylemonella gracilis]
MKSEEALAETWEEDERARKEHSHQEADAAAMLSREQADHLVASYLARAEDEMSSFGSALPGNDRKPKHQLTVTSVSDYDFGWVYRYNTKAFIETGDFSYTLVGNAPLIVDKIDGGLYVTGTARPLEYYIAQFRVGIRSRA